MSSEEVLNKILKKTIKIKLRKRHLKSLHHEEGGFRIFNTEKTIKIRRQKIREQPS